MPEPVEKQIKTKKLKSTTLYRSLSFNRESLDEEKRTVDLAFSSEMAVERYFGNEILDHDSASIRMGRLINGAPLLDNHGRQIGVVEKAEIGADRKGRALVRFGKSVFAEEVYQDVLDGIRTHVSVGYRIHKMVLEKKDEDVPTYRATDWEPYEISIVSIPADTSVGIGRSEGDEFNIEIIEPQEVRDMPDKVPDTTVSTPTVDIDAERAQAVKAEQSRTKEILAIGERYDSASLAREFVGNGKSLEEFRAAVLEKKFDAKPVDTDERNADPLIGMTDKEVKRYSIVKAIREMATGAELTGLEREASDAVSKVCKKQARGFFIPQDVLSEKRALNAGTATAGGYTVGDDVLGGSMVEMLRNKTLISQMGGRTLSGLTGNIMVPKITGGATAYWLSETGDVSGSQQSFGQLGLTPHRLVGDTAFSKELMMQSSLDIENFVREDLMRVLALEKDRAAINGSGEDGEPTGLLNVTGIKTVTFGGPASWGKIIDFETQLANSNAERGTMGFLTTPSARGKWKTTQKVAGNPIFLWENDKAGSGMVNGYRAESTLQVPDNKTIFANWNDLIIAEWAGIDVVVDPYSLKKQGLIEITITLWCDFGVRHAVSFCVSTDSAAQ